MFLLKKAKLQNRLQNSKKRYLILNDSENSNNKSKFYNIYSVMSESIIDGLQNVQVLEDQEKTARFNPHTEQNQNKFNYPNEDQEMQNLKVSYSTRPSRLMMSSWSQKSKSIATRQSFPSKSQICIDSNDEVASNTKNSKQLKKLNDSDVFNCNSCTNDISQKCQICQGKRQLNGGDKIIKFFQYILEFKLGKTQSYQPKKQKLITKKSAPNQHCNIYYSTLNPKFLDDETQQNQGIFSMGNDQQRVASMMNYEQKMKTVKEIHYNYNCDKCQTNPIKGPRYHCSECDDFDLCEQCFNRTGHFHQMNKIQLKSNLKNIQKISSILKNQNVNIRNSIKNTRDSIRNSLAAKPSKSWIR